MSCIACHSSWNPSCFGCHLPQKANKKMPSLHNEGDVSRNYVSYNFQTLRDDVYMLARDGDVTGNRIGPCRSVVCRPRRLVQRQPRIDLRAAADDLRRRPERHRLQHQRAAHRPRRPAHTPELASRTYTPLPSETKMCTDCHVSAANDNNAIMAQLLMQGTNFVNFIGRYCWVAAGEHGFEAVVVTERDEPQAVIGSTLHELAYPGPLPRSTSSDKRELRASPTSIRARTSASDAHARSRSRTS